MKRVIVAAALALVPLVMVRAQTSAWKVSFTLPQSQYVLGAPIVGTIDFHNASSSCVPTPQLYGHFYLDQDPAPCRAWDAPPVEGVPPTPPPGASYGPPSSPKMEQPGATKSFPVNISLLCFERQARNPIGKHRLCLRDTRPNGLGELCVSFSVVAPTGIDAQAYQAFKGHPLKHPAELLKRFPTSTYAGYALMKMGPGGYLQDSEKWVTMTPRQRDIAWAVPLGATAEKQDAHRRQRRDNLSAFVSQARTYLSLHPDFARADILRKEMANALFQLDQRDAALEQVEKLSKMKGPVAEEAQAVMTRLKKASPPAQ